MAGLVAACDDVVAPSHGTDESAPKTAGSETASEMPAPVTLEPPVPTTTTGKLAIASSSILSSYKIEVVAGNQLVTVLWNGNAADHNAIDGYWLGYWDVLTRTWIYRDSNNNPYQCRLSEGCFDNYTIKNLVNGRSYWFIVWAYRGQPGSYSLPSRSAFSDRVKPRDVQFSYYACQQFGDSMPASGVFVDSRRTNSETIAYNACLESAASSTDSVSGRAPAVTINPKLLVDCDGSKEGVFDTVYMAAISLATGALGKILRREIDLEKFLRDKRPLIAQQCSIRLPAPIRIVGRLVFASPVANYRVQYLTVIPNSNDPNEVYCPIIKEWLGTCPQCTNTRVQHCTPASCRDVESCTNTRVEQCTPPSCQDVEICTNTRICDENGCRWDRVCGTERRCTPETCEFVWDTVCTTERQCTPETCEWRWDTVCSDT